MGQPRNRDTGPVRQQADFLQRRAGAASVLTGKALRGLCRIAIVTWSRQVEGPGPLRADRLLQETGRLVAAIFSGMKGQE